MALFLHQRNDNDEEWLIEGERRAAEEALVSGNYVTWRSSNKEDCTRVCSTSLCMCGCPFALHLGGSSKSARGPRCRSCAHCKYFQFVPSRPEEIGEWWLPRRRDYVPGTWRLKCTTCQHPHTDHAGQFGRCSSCARCPGFETNARCVVCDERVSDHETRWESAAERESLGLPTGDAYRPLHDQPELARLLWEDGSPEALEEARAILTGIMAADKSAAGIPQITDFAAIMARRGKGRGRGRLTAGKGERGKGKTASRGTASGGRGRAVASSSFSSSSSSMASMASSSASKTPSSRARISSDYKPRPAGSTSTPSGSRWR